MQTVVTQPDGPGPHHDVLLVQHIGGVSETMKIVARRVAQLGYRCVLPSLYHRLGEIVITPTGGGPDVEEIRRIAVGSVTPETLLTDVAGALAWIDRQPDTAPGPRGILGFGGGASLAFLAAASFPDVFAAFVSVLGVGFIRTDAAWSPHLLAGELATESYFAFAGEDELIPLADVERLRAVLDEAGVNYEIRIHPGVHHGYFFADRDSYSAVAAEDDWERIGALLGRRLLTG
jgi:carboxymethylenebutenolidase